MTPLDPRLTFLHIHNSLLGTNWVDGDETRSHGSVSKRLESNMVIIRNCRVVTPREGGGGENPTRVHLLPHAWWFVVADPGGGGLISWGIDFHSGFRTNAQGGGGCNSKS